MLSQATDVQLAQEIIRRSSASRTNGFILVSAQGSQQQPDKVEAKVSAIAGDFGTVAAMVRSLNTALQGYYPGAMDGPVRLEP